MPQSSLRMGRAIALTLRYSIAPIVLCTAPEAIAQSITAATDGTGTIITIDGSTYTIQGGTQAGTNLFHSFQALGLSTGEIADFLSNPSVTNILGRVTGGDPSIINGLIQVTGANSNLYLMNPAGIVFGSGASLNVGGDFYATTGDRIDFANGGFNATGANDYATLVGAPNQFAFLSEQPGAILNFGDLTIEQNLNLVGGTVLNEGAIASAQGHVTLAAVPGERLVRMSEPGMLLSLEVAEGAIAGGIQPVDLPTLLTGAEQLTNHSAGVPPVTHSLNIGDLIIDGDVSGQRVDLYAAGQVTPTNADFVQGDTRVIRFSETGESPDQAVFIDRRADSPEALLYGAEAGTVSQIIEREENGISVISDQLAVISESVGQLESVAIIAEGNAGNFWLGNQWIRNENIADYAAQLQSWGEALTANADILLYSCFTALGATGEALVQGIADLTGADVAASVDATGSANYDANWELETSTGGIEADNPFTAETLANWEGKLATRTVTNNATSGARTLRDALTDSGGGFATAVAAGDNIIFNLTGSTTINLGNNAITWSTDNLTIDGSNVGGDNVVVNGGGSDRVFNINADNVIIQNLTIQNGGVEERGGGINHAGSGILSLSNTTVTGNRADNTGNNGGGIFSDGAVTLTNSIVSGNTAGSGGGGIWSRDTLTLTNSMVYNNSARTSGGGVNGNANVNLTNSSVSNNSSTIGGGINGDVVSLTNTTVSGNSASALGGGVYGNTLTLTDSTVSNNSAFQSGGIQSNNGLTLTRSTVSGNSATSQGGGIYNSSTGGLTLINATVSGNTAGTSGGGIFSHAPVTLTNSTIAFNSADQGGGLYIGGSPLSNTIANTIIANNTAGTAGPDIHADLNSSTVQNSLIQNTAEANNLTATNSILGQDPLLGPLQNNGGSTQTHALQAGSPAINAGDNELFTATPATDQTGNARIVNGIVDIGAYELPEATTTTTPTATPLTCDVVDDCASNEPIADLTDESTDTPTEGQSTIDPVVEELEVGQVNDFSTFADVPPLTLQESQTILKRIATDTGIQPSLVYFQYAPSAIAQTPSPNPLIASTDLAQLGDLYLSQNTPENSQDQLQIVLVTPEGMPIIKRPLGATRAQVTPVIRRFTRHLNRQSHRYLDAAQQLYDWLIRPLEGDLATQGVQNISIIADEGLRSLPIAALHDGERFVIERYSVGLMPSLSLVDSRYRVLNTPNILAMGASEFTQLTDLPAVPLELDLITQGQRQPPLLNEAFTAANLQTQSRDRSFDILHLATHAVFQAGAPDQAYVQLWGDEALQLHSFRDLKLYQDPALELLILSACQTALGDANAELGFAGSALQAGVKSVLASLWQVSDLGTMRLMSEFYTQLADPAVTIKAEALRQAQLSLLRGEATVQDGFLGDLPLPPELARYQNADLTHPYHWSAFTLVGSPW
ncbi:MAG: CHAT domain-containing protein [Spirulina sp. SIO3F2]|nr:CHAT domain-containing protein [Spirulina sp. SIO3F2]